MGTAIILDPHRLIQDLKKSGFTESQAAVITKALQSVDLGQLSTKGDLRDMELRLIKWTASIVGLGVAIMALQFQYSQ